MPDAFKYSGERKSFQSFNEPYFWTSVIKDWKHLLESDLMKMIIIQSLQWLKQNELVNIYGYVIMPNHIHVLWEQLKMNGKETPKASFEKYTGHISLKRLKADKENLSGYASETRGQKLFILAKGSVSYLNNRRKNSRREIRLYALQPTATSLAVV